MLLSTNLSKGKTMPSSVSTICRRLLSQRRIPLVALLFVLCLLGSSFAQMNLVYVMSNTGLCPTCGPNHNSILAFSNDGTGRLKAVTGSPFATHGTGLYEPNPTPASLDLDEDNELVISPDGNFLFAANMHSNTIAAYNINSDGTLTSVAGSPFASNGPQPASLGLLWDSLPNNGSILVVANKDQDPGQTQTAPNFSTFTVSSTGVLTLNAAGTVPLAKGSAPSNVLVNKKGSLMFGVQFLGAANSTSTLTAYRIKGDGSLSLDNQLTPPAPAHLFLGLAQHPINSALYVGIPDGPEIGVYKFGITTGLLTFNSTAPNSGGLPCWLAINTAGTRLYTGDTGTNTIGVYDTSNSLSLVQLQEFTPSAGGNYPVTNVAIDPTGKFLYALTGNVLHVLTISATDGTLTETVTPRTLPLRAGTIAVGLATVTK